MHILSSTTTINYHQAYFRIQRAYVWKFRFKTSEMGSFHTRCYVVLSIQSHELEVYGISPLYKACIAQLTDQHRSLPVASIWPISLFKPPNDHYLFGNIDIKRVPKSVVFGLLQHIKNVFQLYTHCCRLYTSNLVKVVAKTHCRTWGIGLRWKPFRHTAWLWWTDWHTNIRRFE